MRYKIEFESIRVKKKAFVCILTREIWVDEKSVRNKMQNFRYVVLLKGNIIEAAFVSSNCDLNLQKEAEKALEDVIKRYLKRMEIL
jgi:hypothetical protein